MNLSNEALERYCDLLEVCSEYNAIYYHGDTFLPEYIPEFQELHDVGLIDFEWYPHTTCMFVKLRICDPTDILREKNGTI